jgi:hypothetical protein
LGALREIGLADLVRFAPSPPLGGSGAFGEISAADFVCLAPSLPLGSLGALREIGLADFICNAGGAEGNRTPDLCSAIAALSHLSYSPGTSEEGA